MDVMGLCMRAAIQPAGAKFLPLVFTGDWDSEEQAPLRAVLKNHVPQLVDSTFNTWGLLKLGPGFYSARRATWTQGYLNAGSPEELADRIEDYYQGG